MVGHVDDGVRRGIERAIAAIAAAVHLRVRRQRHEQRQDERLSSCFHKRSELAIDFGAVLDAVDPDESLRGINPVEDAPVADAEFAQIGRASCRERVFKDV